MPVPERHLVLGTPLTPPFPADTERAIFAMGCFWGAERMFWQTPGVFTTAAGYTGGSTPNPTYEEVLSIFFEGHDPTQGMRQGNDVGTQYRSAIFATSDAQLRAAQAAVAAYERLLRQAGFGAITTELAPAGPFYYAEPYHQQYLAANPGGYCGIGGTGVSCPVGVVRAGG